MNHVFQTEHPLVVRIHEQLKHLGTIGIRLPELFGAPNEITSAQIADLLNLAFWSSLRSEEGRPTRAFIYVVDDGVALGEGAFADAMPLSDSVIAKLSPAVPTGGSLFVALVGDQWVVRGFGKGRMGTSLTALALDVADPGVIRIIVGMSRPFAVFSRGATSIIEATGFELAQYLQENLGKALPSSDVNETQAVWRECLALQNLARSLVAHSHGGAILIVPSATGDWEKSLSSFAYRFATPDSTIRDVIRQELEASQAQGVMLQRLSQDDVPEEARRLALSAPVAPQWGGMSNGIRAAVSLANVDGAIVMTKDLQVLGFGAKILTADSPTEVCMFRPQPGSQEVIRSPLEDLGGTRHQSAARFVTANHDCLALVASQDRHLSVAHWSNSIGMVAVVRDAQWWA